jgi:Tetratricopeptide repeat
VTEFIRGVATTPGLGNLPGVIVLSRDLFDAIEFDAACTGDHRAAAQQMSDLAATGTQTDAFPRSEAFVRAGEQWLLADDPAAAANGFRRAIEDGGPAFSDPRVPLARALFLMERPAEAEALISQLEAEQPRDPRVYDLVAELLVELSDLPRALHWATAGVEVCLGRAAVAPATGTPATGITNTVGAAGAGAAAGAAGAGAAGAGAGAAGAGGDSGGPGPAVAERLSALPDSDRAELQLLLRLRYRVRNDLGLPEDRYDLLLDGLGGLSPEPAGVSDTG